MKYLSALTGLLLVILCNSSFAQCGALPIVSGANQTVAVDSRLPTGMSLTGTLTVNAGITLCTEGTASIDVSQLTNNGTINHNGTGLFRADGDVVNNGIVTAVGDFVKAFSAFSFTNSNNASFVCDGLIDIRASFLLNGTNAVLSSTGLGNGIDINCDTDNYGSILADGVIDKSNSGTYVHCYGSGSIVSQNNIDLATLTTTVDAGGSIIAVNNFDLTGIISNSGLLEAQGGYFDKGFNSADPLTNTSTGVIRAFGNMTIEAQITNSGLIEVVNNGFFEKTNTDQTITNNLGGSILVRGAGSVFRARGDMFNSGYIVCEGDADRSGSTSTALFNSSTGYIRVCGLYTKRAGFVNDGVIDVGRDLVVVGASANILRNNAGGKLNVVNNLEFYCNLENFGQVIIGDSLWRTSNSGTTVTVADSGVIFTNNYIHENGSIAGGATAAQIGFIHVCNESKTTNTVNISGFIDICDFGHPGVAPYFDSESPVYTYPTVGMTDCSPLPSGLSAVFVDSCASDTIVTANCATITLPVEFLEFSANLVDENERVKLAWITTSEVNNDFYSIEKSTDGNNYDEIGTVEAEGTSSSALAYSYFDENPWDDISFYRLRQVDVDGSFSYSSIETVYLLPLNISNVYPNPAIGLINIEIGTNEAMNLKIEVINSLGQVIGSFRKDVSVGKTIVEFDTSKLSSGVYLFRVTSPNEDHIEKEFIKK